MEIVEKLRNHRFRYTNEKELQDGIEKVLTDRGFRFFREHDFDKCSRIDFMVVRHARYYGIEVKINGSVNAVLAQLRRYEPYVDELILVTGRSQLNMPAEIKGKPLHVVLVRSGF